VFFKIFGGGVIAQLGFYVNTYYVNNGDLGSATIIEGWKGTTMFAFGIGSIPLWTWLCEKLDKKICMILILFGGFIGSSLNWICVRPDMPYLQLIPVAFTAAVSGALWLIVPSMQADIVDYDELKNGKRREGSHNAMFSWFLKLSFTIAAMLSGFVLEWTGFDVSLGSNQDPEVMRTMLLWWVLLPIIFWGISIVIVALYPLNRRKMHDIRTQLEERRGVL
jgi:GPH family glycoside/pentoside/hexuronide:cation symporter